MTPPPHWSGVAPRSALVTGATGYVGVNLVQHLRRAGWKVRTIDIRPLPPVVGDDAEVDQRSGDVRDPEAVRVAGDGVDVVFHLATRITLWREDSLAWDVNVNGAATVAQVARDLGVARMVHCSSVHAFDLSRRDPLVDETSPRSTDPGKPLYDRSKNAGEAEVRRRVDDGLDATIVNPTGIVGPIDVGPSRVNAVIRAAGRGRLLLAVAGGFDWVDVRDVVTAMISAVDHGRTGESYILGGHFASTLELGRLAAGLGGHVGPLVAVPTGVARAVAPLGEWFGHRLGNDSLTPASVEALLPGPFADIGKARRELGHEPRPLVDTVRDTLEA